MFKQLLRNAPRCLSRGYSNRNILELWDRKGLVDQVFPPESTQDLVRHLCEKPRTFYAGFDPTAESLHLGNLLVIVAMLHAQRAGHKVLAVIGKATAKIGDPSGKLSERDALSSDDIDRNAAGLRSNLESIFANHELLCWKGDRPLQPLEVLDNTDWYENVNVVEFLGSVGRHFRMARMLGRDSVRTRLESAQSGVGLSFAEFSYQVLQAYDWYHLHKAFGCSVQLGGSDQMGNVASGYEFITRFKTSMKDGKRKATNDNYGVLLPLVTNEAGQKLGKTEGNTVWLSRELTSPFDFYQYFLRLPDSEVEKMISYFTFLPASEIEDLMEAHNKDTSKRKAQAKLAEHLTELVHGEGGLRLAETTTDIFYGSENVGDKLASLGKEELAAVFSQASRLRFLSSPTTTVLDLANKIGCFANEKDALKVIERGGFSINQVKRTNCDEVLVLGIHVLPNQTSLVRVGKKHYVIVEWMDS